MPLLKKKSPNSVTRLAQAKKCCNALHCSSFPPADGCLLVCLELRRLCQIWHKRRSSKQTSKQPSAGGKLEQCSALQHFFAWASLVTLLGLFFLSSGIGDLLLYSTHFGIHIPPA